MEFAIIETGGKQYRVSAGDSVVVEKLAGEYKDGEKVTFDKVLALHDGKDIVLGTPYIDGATVEAKFEKGGKGKKVTVIHFKSKSRYFKKRGHRQLFTKVKISKVIKK